jgi:hypothetical protein
MTAGISTTRLPAADFGGPNRYPPPASSVSERATRTVPLPDLNIAAPQCRQLAPPKAAYLASGFRLGLARRHRSN